MFGERPNPPNPPKYEPFLLLLLAVGVSALLTAIFIGVWYLAEKGGQ